MHSLLVILQSLPTMETLLARKSLTKTVSFFCTSFWTIPNELVTIYVSEPEEPSTTAILYLTDVFGIQLPENKL